MCIRAFEGVQAVSSVATTHFQILEPSMVAEQKESANGQVSILDCYLHIAFSTHIAASVTRRKTALPAGLQASSSNPQARER